MPLKQQRWLDEQERRGEEGLAQPLIPVPAAGTTTTASTAAARSASFVLPTPFRNAAPASGGGEGGGGLPPAKKAGGVLRDKHGEEASQAQALRARRCRRRRPPPSPRHRCHLLPCTLPLQASTAPCTTSAPAPRCWSTWLASWSAATSKRCPRCTRHARGGTLGWPPSMPACQRLAVRSRKPAPSPRTLSGEEECAPPPALSPAPSPSRSCPPRAARAAVCGAQLPRLPPPAGLHHAGLRARASGMRPHRRPVGPLPQQVGAGGRAAGWGAGWVGDRQRGKLERTVVQAFSWWPPAQRLSPKRCPCGARRRLRAGRT